MKFFNWENFSEKKNIYKKIEKKPSKFRDLCHQWINWRSIEIPIKINLDKVFKLNSLGIFWFVWKSGASRS